MNDRTLPDATQAGKPIGPTGWARINACLAACEGIPTEALEAGVVADMLEALKAAKTFIALGGDQPMMQLVRQIDAAIAKVEGKQ
jgi:hypothetical protein